MEKQPFRIIQISDMHLFSDPEEALLGVNTEESFKAVLAHLRNTHKKIDLIILSGDLSQDGSTASYIRLADLLKPFDVPIYYVPGNHDDIKAMQKIYPRGTIVNDKQILLKKWQLILLDSKKPRSVEGHLPSAELDFLKKCLDDYPLHDAIIVFHHQPVQVESEWLDKLGVANADEFWKTIAPYHQVKAIFFGHVHQDIEKKHNGVYCYAVPSTCIQFKCKKRSFGLAELTPGYRWVDLYDDGRIQTAIVRIDKYIGTFDGDAKGY